MTPKRYGPVQYLQWGGVIEANVEERPDGEFVRWEDYESLLAECVRLRDLLPRTDAELGLKSFGESMANYQAANLRQ
jgi:hypothetical protein